MQEDTHKKLLLAEELDSSIKLINLGLGEVQNLNMENNFFHLPFQLLSSGFERLMKCYICFGHFEVKGHFPSSKLFKSNLSHDLLLIKEYITEHYFKTNNIPVLKDDETFLLENKGLNDLLHIFSEFGKISRYYNLDVVTGEKKRGIDVQALWQEFESKLINNDERLREKINDFELSKEVFDEIYRTIIIKLERFIRALTRQFTMGKLGKLAKQYSGATYAFLMLKDEQLGTTNYRLHTTRYQRKEYRRYKRTALDEVERQTNKNYISKLVKKSEFSKDWPFYADEVVIECRDKHRCIVSIDGCDYALNGTAHGYYKLEFAHDAGVAILGKSLHHFNAMALDLGKHL